MKILLTNSVPLNGGDEALLRATYMSLQSAFPQSEITVLCSKLELCKKYIKDIKLDSDIEYIRTTKLNIKERFFFKTRMVLLNRFNIGWDTKHSLLFANKDEIRIKNLYRSSDLVISSPGGFLHDHYPIENRVAGFRLAINYKKPVIIFAQSVGPFWKKESIDLVNKEFKKLSAIILREKISLEYLKICGVVNKNVYVTSDAAFLWRKLMPELFIEKKGTVKTIAMCFRNWPLVDDKINETIVKAVELCKYLLTDENRTIIFLSTCQGIPGYVDDSIHAVSILNKLPDELKKRCKIDSTRYSPVDLIKTYSQCDAFIGMRLHSAILSMLGGTAAMGLGYEDKTEGIFTSLGIEKYQVPYDATLKEWIACTNTFINDIDSIRDQLLQSLDSVADIAMESIEIIKKTINKV